MNMENFLIPFNISNYLKVLCVLSNKFTPILSLSLSRTSPPAFICLNTVALFQNSVSCFTVCCLRSNVYIFFKLVMK